jgi:NADH-ubiquinone oxidoreductase chain 4
MPIFSIIFFILCLGNAGTPLTLNFIGEFLCLYGIFERLPLLGVLSSTSIIFSAAYTIYMFNRTVFGGSYSKLFLINVIDLSKREFIILIILIFFTITLGIYPLPITEGLNYNLSGLIYSSI